jgi:glycosidase
VLPDTSAPPILQIFQASWNTIDQRAADIFDAGYGGIWVPPPGRADSGNQSVGYDVYNRFDLGSPGNPTLYGTEAGLKALASAVHQFDGKLYLDLVWNHDGFRDQSSVDGQGHSFANAGGYPGFVLSATADPNGDFHDRNATSTWDMRVAGLIDIAQDKNYQYVRSPVPGYGNNLPAGTTPAYGQLANVPDSNNTRFYPDTSLQPIIVYDPRTGEQNLRIYPFNNANPQNGTPVAENALGYLMRNAQWLVQYVGADGFRVDAAKNMPPWVLNYLDRAVYRSSFRTYLNGSQENVFSFSEVYDGDKNLLQQYVRKDINPNTPGVIGGNRDDLDFPLFFALRSNLSGNGLQNDWRNVIGASLDTSNHGSVGVSFVSSQDDFGPYLSNVAYAYTLTRPGNAIVYDNAHQFAGFPRDGRGDALGGLYGNTITTLVNIRDTHPDGNFDQRDLEKEILIFERDNSLLVGLNNRLDAGYDTRTVHTNFAPGTYLVELTGNAGDPTLDPRHDIPPVVQVDGNGNVTIRVPRNRNANGVETDKGYVIYAPAGPQGQLHLSNIDHVIPGQTPTAATNGTARLASIPVVATDSFQVELDTNAVNLLGQLRDRNADGDNALFEIDGGVDVTGRGFVSTDPNSVAYGFQQFVTLRSPGYSNADGNGRYVQTIDTSRLSDGLHYITVRVFRHRNAGEPPIFTDFRQAVYVQHSPGFSDADINLPDVQGSASYDVTSGRWTVRGGGSDIWGRADQFNYVSEAVSGDMTIVAQVNSVQNTDPWAKAGVMVRNDLSAGAPFAAVVVTPGNGVNFQWRSAADGQANGVQVTGVAAPVWVELVRSGNDFSAFYSADGASWTQIGTTQTLAFSGSARAGLAVTSHNPGAGATATFDNVSLTEPVDLSSGFNLAGIVSDGTQTSDGGLDGNGNSYSADLLGTSVTAGGVTFNLGAAGANNVVQAAGQTLALTAGQFSALTFLATAVNGAQASQTFIVNYTDGTSDTFTQDLSDWQNPQGFAGESIAAALSYYDAGDGSSPGVPNYLYRYTFTLNKQKTVSSITLPMDSNVMILALDLLS